MVKAVRHHEFTNTVGYEELHCYTHILHKEISINVCQYFNEGSPHKLLTC